jgi:hypothetical protein
MFQNISYCIVVVNGPVGNRRLLSSVGVRVLVGRDLIPRTLAQ